jgi:diaminohydroxyphosphoribosylaminopyrimidine deaminase/5-amino-6-(5-phosphoribosylamino)uracil reductase
VGCVIIGQNGQIAGEGFHRGAPHPHAEVEALTEAARRGSEVRGGVAVVTLEPCAHEGRTGPCAQALVEAGIAEVVFAGSDPNPVAAGGAAFLANHGVMVRRDLDPGRAAGLNPAWTFALTHARPFITLKMATTLDGRIAAPDGTSQWITSKEARAHAHTIRAEVDAIAVGTGTVLADDPALTARIPGAHQPARVIIGRRDIPAQARLWTVGEAEVVHLRTHDPHAVAAHLAEREVRHLLVEGGAGVATAFLRAGLVDEIHAYVEPMILGAGRSAVAGLGVETLTDAPRWETTNCVRLGTTVFIAARRLVGRPTDDQEG